MTQTEIPAVDREAQRDALTGRIFEAAVGTFDLLSIYLGDRLGYYEALRGRRLTARELARTTGTHERYVREWLEQQAVTGILAVDDVTADEWERRFSIPEGHDEVLLDEDSFSHLAPLGRAIATVGMKLPELLQCFRSGSGIAWPDFGDDMRQAQEALNRPVFVNLLGTEYLPNVPAIHDRLSSDTPATVADIGCGAGWSSIAIAKAYPNARVTGYDLDAVAIERARHNAEAAGVADRVTFEARDAADPALAGAFDVVTVFEAVHDMSRPVDALRVMRGLLKQGGCVLVMDERTAETFTAPANIIERFFYGASVFVCLPGGMSEQPSAGTGTVMRASKLAEYAEAAGYGHFEVLPLHHDCFRFYLLAE